MPYVNPAQLCQIELPVSDAERALAFYENVLGWRPVPAEIHNYIVLEVPEGHPFGISLVPQQKQPTSGLGATLYFRVPNPEEIIANVTAYAGIDIGSRQLPSRETIHLFTDPDGNRFGVVRGE